jgi:hypothetical protein
VLTTNVLNAAAGGPDGSQLPIISIEAQAPDPSGATRLANAAVAGLRDYLGSVAASEGVPEARRLRVTSLGAPVAVAVVQAPGLMLGVAAFVVVFLLGCGVIIVIPAMVREWRGASDHQVPVALNRHIPAAPDVPVPVALDHHIPVASDRHVPLAADRHVPVASAIPAPVSAEKPLPVPVRTVERPTGFSYVSVPVDDRREPDVDIAPGERLRREVARHQ